MSKFCTKCGNQISDEGMFCPKCGRQCESVIVESNSVNTADTSSSNNSDEIPENVDIVKLAPKKKPKKKLIVSLAIAVPILAVVVAVGIICILHLFSSGRPSVVALDEDKTAFNLTFEEFKSGFSNSIEPVFKATNYEISDYTVDEYKAEFINEDNWYSWEEDNHIYHKWTYKYNDAFSYEIFLEVDKDSNKIRSIDSTSYYPDIITKTILTSYILYGYKDIDNNIESIYNLSIFLSKVVEESKYILNIDGVGVFSMELEDYHPTYCYGPLSDSDKFADSYSGKIINLTHDDLTHFDKALSARYGIDYEWQKVPNRK